jgi:hypothetical protein
MIGAAFVEWRWGVAAERQPLLKLSARHRLLVTVITDNARAPESGSFRPQFV